MKKLLFLLVFTLLVFTTTCFGATYYIDFTSGNDASAGTAEGTAWKTIPGTRNTGDTDWQATDWGSGTFNSGSKVPAGTIFRIKPGTTHDSSDGGQIDIESTYYDADATAANPIKFVAYQAWAAASGTITFDGTGITTGANAGLIRSYDIPGLEFDGEVTNGITIQDTPYNGMTIGTSDALEIGTDAMLDGAVVKYIKFSNCGTTYTSGDNQVPVLFFEHFQNVTVDNIEIDGNDLYLNGIQFGAQHRGCSGTVTDSSFHDLTGTDGGGIGILSNNSTITYTNVTVYGCNKGFDLGEQDGNDVAFTAKVINSTFYNNATGANFNGASGRTSDIKVYLINNIFRDNTLYGSKTYARGPFQSYIVHNVFDNNGTDADNDSTNLMMHSDGCDEEGVFTAFLYNNIFYKPAGESNFCNYYTGDGTEGYDTNFTMTGDYNAWIDNTANASAVFADLNFTGCQSDPPIAYDYDADGPGNNTGNWYTDDDEPGNGTLHQGCDEHSKTADAIPFTSVSTHDYTLTEAYIGTDLSGLGWYTSEMGVDRNSVARVGDWDIGAYDFVGGAPDPVDPPAGLTITGGTGTCLTGGADSKITGATD